MNPVPFMLYREQLTKMAVEAAESPGPADEPIVTNAVSRAATPQSVIEISIAGVVACIRPDVDMALLTEVLRAVRRSESASA